MPHAGFVHLRLQSAYSMLEGAIQPEDLAKHCRRGGFPAAGLADRGNMFAAMDFSYAAKEAGVQPIIGALVAVERPGSRTALTPWRRCMAARCSTSSNLNDSHVGAYPVGDGSV
jgi:DNA polymerase-3 subunit alpha